MVTQQQAQLICDAHEIDLLLENIEEVKSLEANNLELLDAYRALSRMAVGSDAVAFVKSTSDSEGETF